MDKTEIEQTTKLLHKTTNLVWHPKFPKEDRIEFVSGLEGFLSLAVRQKKDRSPYPHPKKWIWEMLYFLGESKPILCVRGLKCHEDPIWIAQNMIDAKEFGVENALTYLAQRINLRHLDQDSVLKRLREHSHLDWERQDSICIRVGFWDGGFINLREYPDRWVCCYALSDRVSFWAIIPKGKGLT